VTTPQQPFDISRLVAPGSRGGIFDLTAPLDLDALRSAVDGVGARLAVLDAPDSKEELLHGLSRGLSLPAWFGRNWDALEEVLGSPEPSDSSAIVLVWFGPESLDSRTRETFESIVGAASERRSAQGLGALALLKARTERMFDTLLIWTVQATAGVDSAWVSLRRGQMTVRGHVSSQRPEPYSVRYSLETGRGYETRQFTAEVVTADGTRQLELRQDGGKWLVNGMPRSDLDGALDCDIEGCPMTNTMPILRNNLHRQPGQMTYMMAFVQLPDLTVSRMEQTYGHSGLLADGMAVVRYRSAGFEADLLVDGDGFVVEYPKLGAHRVVPE